MNKLKNIFKIGRKSSTETMRKIKISFLDKVQNALNYSPYGLQSNPPDNIPIGLLSDQGNEESLVGLPFDPDNKDELSDGEVSIGIPAGADRIIFKNDGRIVFKIGSVEGGDFMARFNELKVGFDELKQDYNDHITAYNAHIHPDPVSGTTGTPTVTGTPSTASIDDAKIDEIEVPEL